MPPGDLVKVPANQRGVTAAKCKERHEGDADLRALVHQRGVLLIQHAKAVLHRGDRRDGAGLDQLRAGHIADPKMADQALVAQLGKGAEAVADRVAARRRQAAHPQVHQVQDVDGEFLEVLLDRRAQLLGCGLADQLAGGVAQRADLGGDRQVGGVGVQGRAQDVVGAVGTMKVEGGGVKVADAKLHGAARNRQRRRLVDGGTVGSTRQVHGAKAQPGDREDAAQLEGAHGGVDRR